MTGVALFNLSPIDFVYNVEQLSNPFVNGDIYLIESVDADQRGIRFYFLQLDQAGNLLDQTLVASFEGYSTVPSEIRLVKKDGVWYFAAPLQDLGDEEYIGIAVGFSSDGVNWYTTFYKTSLSTEDMDDIDLKLSAGYGRVDVAVGLYKYWADKYFVKLYRFTQTASSILFQSVFDIAYSSSFRIWGIEVLVEDSATTRVFYLKDGYSITYIKQVKIVNDEVQPSQTIAEPDKDLSKGDLDIDSTASGLFLTAFIYDYEFYDDDFLIGYIEETGGSWGSFNEIAEVSHNSSPSDVEGETFIEGGEYYCCSGLSGSSGWDIYRFHSSDKTTWTKVSDEDISSDSSYVFGIGFSSSEFYIHIISGGQAVLSRSAGGWDQSWAEVRSSYLVEHNQYPEGIAVSNSVAMGDNVAVVSLLPAGDKPILLCAELEFDGSQVRSVHGSYVKVGGDTVRISDGSYPDVYFDGSALWLIYQDPSNKVKLLYSTDRGKTWQVASGDGFEGEPIQFVGVKGNNLYFVYEKGWDYYLRSVDIQTHVVQATESEVDEYCGGSNMILWKGDFVLLKVDSDYIETYVSSDGSSWTYASGYYIGINAGIIGKLLPTEEYLMGVGIDLYDLQQCYFFSLDESYKFQAAEVFSYFLLPQSISFFVKSGDLVGMAAASSEESFVMMVASTGVYYSGETYLQYAWFTANGELAPDGSLGHFFCSDNGTFYYASHHQILPLAQIEISGKTLPLDIKINIKSLIETPLCAITVKRSGETALSDLLSTVDEDNFKYRILRGKLQPDNEYTLEATLVNVMGLSGPTCSKTFYLYSVPVEEKLGGKLIVSRGLPSKLRITLPSSDGGKVWIYDISGRLVWNGDIPEGRDYFDWSMVNGGGQEIVPGVYRICIKISGRVYRYTYIYGR